jgi:hypothetical protein
VNEVISETDELGNQGSFLAVLLMVSPSFTSFLYQSGPLDSCFALGASEDLPLGTLVPTCLVALQRPVLGGMSF